MEAGRDAVRVLPPTATMVKDAGAGPRRVITAHAPDEHLPGPAGSLT